MDKKNFTPAETGKQRRAAFWRELCGMLSALCWMR